jgi:hypothetical protein
MRSNSLACFLQSHLPSFLPCHPRALASELPSRCVGKDLTLLFSTASDGYSLATLYARARGKGPTFLVVMDEAGAIFGAFLSHDLSAGAASFGAVAAAAVGAFTRGSVGFLPASPASRGRSNWSSGASGGSGGGSGGGAPRVPASGRFFGSGESFLFATRPSLAFWRWARNDSLFMLTRDDGLGIGGGGGHFGLWLDATLERGASMPSSTFGNRAPIASAEVFRIVRVELYGFVLPAATATASAGGSSSSSSGGGGGGARATARRGSEGGARSLGPRRGSASTASAIASFGGFAGTVTRGGAPRIAP